MKIILTLTAIALLAGTRSGFAQDASKGLTPRGVLRVRSEGAVDRVARLRLAAQGADFTSVSNDPPTPQEWTQISEFAQQNFKNRWKVFERARELRGENSEAVKAIKLKMAMRYRAIKTLEDDFPDFYKSTLAQGKVEDEAFGALENARSNPDDPTLRTELRNKVRALVESAFQQRTIRLNNLQNLIDEEKRVLDDDQAHMDRVIDRQIARLMSNIPFGGPIEGGRLRDGYYMPDPSTLVDPTPAGSGPTTQPKNQ